MEYAKLALSDVIAVQEHLLVINVLMAFKKSMVFANV
jgi:hypothetical protein